MRRPRCFVCDSTDIKCATTDLKGRSFATCEEHENLWAHELNLEEYLEEVNR